MGNSCGARVKSVRLRVGAVGVSAEGWIAACHSQERVTGMSHSKASTKYSMMRLLHRTGAQGAISRES